MDMLTFRKFLKYELISTIKSQEVRKMQTQIVKRVDCSNLANAIDKLSEAVEQANAEGYVVTQIIPTHLYANGQPYELALLCTLYQR